MELTSTVLFFMLLIPVYMEVPTGAPSSGISCADCSEGFNKTHNWRCRFGCGKFYRGTRYPAKAPVSVTRPTPGTGPTRRGSFLDCKKCFGHGFAPSPDPRCKFGCGRWMTWPLTTVIKPATFTDSPDTKSDIESDIAKNTEPLTDDNPGILKATAEAPLARKDSLKTIYLRYKNSFLIIGLFAGLAAMLVGSVFYRRWRRRNTKTSPADVAVVMHDLYI